MARKFKVSGFRTEGFAALQLALDELPANLGKAAARRAMRRAGEDMADAQRALVPVASGELRDSIGLDVSTRNLTGLAAYADARAAGGSSRDAARAMRTARRTAKKAGAAQGTRIAVNVGAKAPHAHLVEFGTAPRKQKNGKSTGTMPAEPFIRPAFDAGKDRAIATIRDGLAEEIKLTAARAAKRAARKALKGR